MHQAFPIAFSLFAIHCNEISHYVRNDSFHLDNDEFSFYQYFAVGNSSIVTKINLSKNSNFFLTLLIKKFRHEQELYFSGTQKKRIYSGFGGKMG